MTNLDKFYTKKEVAKDCIGSIPDIESYHVIIEPAAGSGAFSNQLKNSIALDIAPENDSIIKQDWFEFKEILNKKILVVGNPPFGRRSSLAKNFIKHAIKIGAETIAFILPETFSKINNQGLNLFPKEWKLIVEKDLPENAFEIDKKEYHVPCKFYVWTKRPSNINLRKNKLQQTSDFIFLKRADMSADFCINGNSGKVRLLTEITNEKAEHFIKAKDKTKEELKEIFSKLEYIKLSSVNGGNFWIGQQEILEAYYNFRGLKHEI